MRKGIKDTIDIALKFKEIVGALAAIALWVLALWFSYKLAPVIQDQKNLELRVSAVEAGHQSDHDTIIRIDTNQQIMMRFWNIPTK